MIRARLALAGLLVCIPLLGGPTFADTSTSLGDHGGEGSTVFTGLAQTPEANMFTGALGTRIAIDVPPGRKNITPQLALVYSSAGGASPFGYGWDLPLGRIQRSTKYGVPRCDWHTDDFVISLPSGTSELVKDPAGSTTYRPKVEEGYLEVIKDEANNTWSAYDRSGMRYVFGNYAWARVGNDTSVFMSAGPPCRFTTAWALTHVEDPNGNSMDITYQAISNVLYPDAIYYGGNATTGMPHFYFVAFTYEPRPPGDMIESDLSGATAVLSKRATLIRVATNVPSYNEFRVYTLTYDSGGNGQQGYQSFLSAVSVTGQPNATLFTYAQSTAGHASESYTPPSGWTGLRTSDATGNVTRTVMDINGDGYVDLVTIWPGSWVYYKGGPNGPATGGTALYLPAPSVMDKIRAVRTNALPCTAGTTCTERDTFDINGDGFPDFIDARTTPWTVYLGTGQGFSGGIPWTVPQLQSPMTPIREDTHPGGETRTFQDVLDINGDGLPDLVQSGNPTQPLGLGSYTWLAYLNTGSGFSLSPISFPAPLNMIHRESQPNFGIHTGTVNDLIDFNGDGLVDLVAQPLWGAIGGYLFDAHCMTQYEIDNFLFKVCLYVYPNTGQGFGPPQYVPVPNYSTVIRGRDNFNRTTQDLVDVNGDGLPDYVLADASQGPTFPWGVLLNRGGTLEPFNINTAGGGNQAILRSWTGGQGILRVTTNGGSPNTTIDILDFDGDGMMDEVDTNATPWTFHRNRNFVQNRAKANALGSLKNGLGGMTTLLYTPSTRFDNTAGDGTPDLPFVTWVTTGIRQSDGLCDPGGVDVFNRSQNLCIDGVNLGGGHEQIATFTYQDGKFDGPTREFRGFRKVFRTDIDGNVQATTFGQTVAAKGKILNVDTYAGSSQFVRQMANVWSTASIGAGRTQLWVGFNQVVYNDLNGISYSVAYTYNDQPDAYGNVLHTYRTDYAGTTRIDTYTTYGTPSGTRVYDKPWRVYSTYTQPSQAAVTFERKWFFYDSLASQQVSKGNVTSVESWLDQSTGTAPPACTADGSKLCVRAVMAYDSYGNLRTVTDALGNLTSTTYEDGYFRVLYPYQVKRRVTASPFFELITTTLTDYRWGKPTSVTDPNGAVTSYTYDTAGRPTCTTLPGDATCSMKYTYVYATQLGQVSAVGMEHKEPNQTTTYPNQPDAGYVTTTRYFDALGRSRHTAGFRVVNAADQTVIADRVEYDAAGRVAKRYDSYPLAPGTDARTQSPGTANNGFRTYEYLLNASTYLDPLGRLHKITKSDGMSRTTTYSGFTTYFYDEENHRTTSTVDFLGRVVRKEVYSGTTSPYPLYAYTAYTYDGAGRVLTTTQNGTAATTITTSYDSLGRKVQMVDPDTGPSGTAGTWRYGYDQLGNLIHQDDPSAAQHVQFCYDALNRTTKKYYLTTDTYQTVDCVTAGAGDIRYTYDAGTWGKGRLTQVDEAVGATSFAYDNRGRILSTTKTITVNGISNSATTAVQYDASDTGRVWKTTYPDNELVTTTYDASGQPKALTGYITDARYDVLGRPTTIQHANGTTDTRDYYGAPGSGSFQEGHRLKQVKTQGPSGTYLDLSYLDYNNRGLLAQLTDNRNASGVLSNTATFGYDDFARLTAVTNSPNMTASYGYNNVGNITAKEGQTYTYDPTKPHQLLQAGSTVVDYDSNGNTSLGRSAQTYVYDKDDRLSQLSANGTNVTFKYDYSGQRVAKLVGTSVTRYYSDLHEGTNGELTKYYFLGGLRVAAQRINSTLYAQRLEAPVQVAAMGTGHPALVLWLRRDVQIGGALGTMLLATSLLLAPWRRKRVVGIAVRHGHIVGIMIAFGVSTLPWPLLLRPLGPKEAEAQTPPTLVHFHVDHLGSTEVVTTSTGTVFEQTRYKAYGEIRGHWDLNGSSQLTDCADDRYCHEFTGYDTEPISQIDYAGARYYDPQIGVFLTHDPAREFGSPYTYTNWNPTNATDPDGACLLFGLDCLTVALILVAATAVATAIDTGVRTGNVGAAFTAGAIAGAIGLAGVGLGVVVAPAFQALPTIAQYAVVLGAGGYGTYQAVDNGYYGTAIVGAFATLLGAYGIYKGPNGEAVTSGGNRPAGPQSAQAAGGTATDAGAQTLWSEDNQRALARILQSEASVGNASEREAVGASVVTRMLRNGTTDVTDVWGAYAHGQEPEGWASDLARDVLSGGNTGGATHFYSPRSMPLEGQPVPAGVDVGGGLEQTPGLRTQNYRPSWAATYGAVQVEGARPSYFRFYRAPGSGPVY